MTTTDRGGASGSLIVAASGTLVLLALRLGLPSLLAPGVSCGFRDLTGLPCAGCGMTRGLMALLGGDPASAIRFHPISPVVLGVMVGLTVWAWADVARGTATLPLALARRGLPACVALAALLLATWAIRL